MTDYFAVLGLRRTASDREIKEAYRRLAKMYHPDPNPGNPESERRMQSINEAKAVLFDSVKREEHRVLLGLREKLTAQRIAELRQDARFVKTSEYTPPRMRRPQSKWDRMWKRYVIGISGAVILGAGMLTVSEWTTREPAAIDPIHSIIARHHQTGPLGFDDSVREDLFVTPALDTLQFAGESPERLKRHGDILFALAEFQSAAKYYEQYLRNAPNDDTVIRNLSFAYFKRGRYAESLEVLSKQLHGDSNLVVAYYNVGESFLREEKPFDARDAFAAAARIADTMARSGRLPPSDGLRAKRELARLE